jgi:hypothetical protein
MLILQDHGKPAAESQLLPGHAFSIDGISSSGLQRLRCPPT